MTTFCFGQPIQYERSCSVATPRTDSQNNFEYLSRIGLFSQQSTKANQLIYSKTILYFFFFLGSSPRSYDSSGVGSWSQDSRHASPFHLIGSSKIPPSSKQDFDSEVTFDQKSPLRRSRSRNDISDMDPGTILLQGSTPTPREEEENSEDADTDQPKDFSMKTLLAKEEEESQKKSSLSRSERVDAKDNLTEQESNNIFFNVGNCTFPNVSKSNCILIPPQISIPYYFPPPLVPNPFHASLPNDFLLHLAGTPPSSLPNADPLGSSAPGHIDGRIQRFSRRAAPYYKVLSSVVVQLKTQVMYL